MKKVGFLCVMLILCLSTVPVLATAIYVENFSFEEPGTGKISDWTRVPGWSSDTSPEDSGVEEYGVATDGTWSAFLMGGDPSIWQLTEHVISNGDSITLVFDACTTWTDTGISYVTASLYYDDAGTRVTVAEQEYELNWSPMLEYSLTFSSVSVPESIGHQIGIEFINSADGWLGLDSIRLNIDYAGIVYPPDGSTNIPVDADLEWTLKSGFNCDVYFSTDPNIPIEDQVIFNEAVTTYDPGTLEFETTYYWKVDPIDPNDGSPIVYSGEIWSFTTMGALPYIVSQPQSITIASGDDAVFTIDVASPTELTYKWYKVGDTINVLSTTDTLTIPNIQTGDEAYFYCVVENEEGPVTSDQARLLTQRLMGRWKLDGDATDSVALEIPSVPTHDGILPADPNFIVDGIDNQGYAFYGDGRIIEIADSSEYFNFYPQGMTVSVWVKTSTTTWDGVVAKHYRPEEDTWLGWLIDVNGGSCHFTVRGSTGDLWGSDDDGDMFDGNWHLVSGVMDPATQTSRVYVDGVERGESGVYDMTAALLSSEPVVFGAETVLGQIPYTGQIDDVRIYSYPLSTVDIAMLYTEFNPGVNVCIDRDDPWMYFDVAGEPGESSYCKIDLEDFAEMVALWMECNLVPECIQ